jgi:hypothetical protein
MCQPRIIRLDGWLYIGRRRRRRLVAAGEQFVSGSYYIIICQGGFPNIVPQTHGCAKYL